MPQPLRRCLLEMSKNKQGTLAIISGPSGVGKSTVIAKVMQARPDLYFSVSYTTRTPRTGEVDGIHYHFVSRPEFERMIADNELLEYAEYSGNYYGTSAKLIDSKLAAGIDVLLDIEVVGSKIVHDKRPDTPLIFVIPPSFEELSRRLHDRQTDAEDVIQRRLARAKEELKEVSRYDYLVVNDVVEDAAAEVCAILKAEGCRTDKRIYLVEE